MAGGYNAESIWTPYTRQELEQELWNATNKGLTNLGINTITLDVWRYSNSKFLNDLSLQTMEQLSNNMGLLYDMIKQAIQLKIAELSPVQPASVKAGGSTFTGLLNTLESVKGVSEVSLIDPNNRAIGTLPNNISIGLRPVSLAEPIDNEDFFQKMLNNHGFGVYTEGAVEITTADSKGVLRTYAYDLIEDNNMFVKIFYKYSTSYQGNLMIETVIESTYTEKFNEFSETSKDVEPATINDISYYPSLAYLNTQFSTDGGLNYLPLNEVLTGEFPVKWLLDVANIIITQE